MNGRKERGGSLWGPVVWLQSFYILTKSEMTGKNASSRKSKRAKEQKSKRAKEQKPAKKQKSKRAKASKRGVKIVALLNKKNRQEHICTVKIQKQDKRRQIDHHWSKQWLKQIPRRTWQQKYPNYNYRCGTGTGTTYNTMIHVHVCMYVCMYVHVCTCMYTVTNEKLK
jgi:hypothetical protein